MQFSFENNHALSLSPFICFIDNHALLMSVRFSAYPRVKNLISLFNDIARRGNIRGILDTTLYRIVLRLSIEIHAY